MSVADKITHSFVNAVSPRTAGFNTVELPQFSTLSIMLYMLLMWIGGGSQSTAGGIKVNTLAVVLANFVSMLKGRERVVLFNREVSDYSIKKASAVVVGSIVCILTFFVLLVRLEPHLPTQGLLFETISAFSTVGASLNITPLLSVSSKLLITVLMFIGRVGLISLLMSFTKRAVQPHYRYPKDHVIIN
jgi:Trk-type K+ transport system membrane component